MDIFVLFQDLTQKQAAKHTLPLSKYILLSFNSQHLQYSTVSTGACFHDFCCSSSTEQSKKNKLNKLDINYWLRTWELRQKKAGNLLNLIILRTKNFNFNLLTYLRGPNNFTSASRVSTAATFESAKSYNSGKCANAALCKRFMHEKWM